MASPAGILIVDDERVAARDMVRCLEDAGYRVTGTARSPVEALQQIEENRPDLVLIDTVLGPHDGISLARRLHERGVPFVYVSARTDPDTLARAKESEPLGFIVKPFGDSQLRSTVEVALHTSQRTKKDSESVGPSHEVRARLAALEEGIQRIANLVKELGLVAPEAGRGPEVEAILGQLSSRERQIVELLLASRRVPGIASTLGISPHTVRNHLKSVFRKLGVHSQEAVLDLLRTAAAHGRSPRGAAT